MISRPVRSATGPSRHWGRLLALALALALAACSRTDRALEEQARVNQSFQNWQNAVIHNRPEEAIAYFPRHVDDYVSQLNSSPPPAAAPWAAHPAAPASPSPGVDLLLRVALEKKVPPDLRAKLTLATLLRRITERHLFNPRDVREITLGPVSVNGNRADAVVYYQGTLTALRLPFIKEDDTWKIDVMSLLPYAELLMHVDRAMKGETEAQQVDQLVAKLPAL
jgi:hypothetical protein